MKCTKGLNIRPDTVKFLGGNIEKKLIDIGFGNDFFRYDTKCTTNKSKNQQVGLPQTKMLLYTKRNNQQHKKKRYRI